MFRQCMHVWSYHLWTRVCKFQIDLQLYVYMYLKSKYMYKDFEKVNIVFRYIMQNLDTSGTSKHYVLANACTISSCHINTGSRVRRIMFKRQQCMYKSEQRYINENLLPAHAYKRHFFGYSQKIVTKIFSLHARLIFRRRLIRVYSACS